MFVGAIIDKRKVHPKIRIKALGTVAHVGQPAAFHRTTWCKDAGDGTPAVAQSTPEPRNVGNVVCRVQPAVQFNPASMRSRTIVSTGPCRATSQNPPDSPTRGRCDLRW